MGIISYKKEEPVSFYTTEKPVQKDGIIDVKKWNHAHGIMFIIYSALIFGDILITLLIKNEWLSVILFFVIYLLPLPLLIIGHHIIKKKLKK